MKVGIVAFGVLCAAVTGCASVPAREVSLFEGGLSAWELRTEPAAPLEDVVTVLPDGVLAVAGKPPGFFATRAVYRDYRLHVEWRWTGQPGNAGMLLHISEGPMDRVWPVSLQVQTKRGSAGDLLPMAGASFAETATSPPGAQPVIKAHTAPDSELAVGAWNSADIVCRDGTVAVSINGVPQNRVTAVRPAAGRIGFQLEGAPYQLRNVTLVRLVPLE
ncbi:3-keto-disaccharide hydrolase [Pseudoduganella armeniaca]|uniref:3-keto-alpha-glucoside-1,2-lyase/3-keto-2-hydroxy-glucal hydratase domain-containing protein n=1 Tax=Pseudoduganella armeniaca TaxID=2072590 RepID=A0A2R4C863_9BURK|nr:DUF1080 domain-containing protein [Pseudoduganella armeniaca]AVR95738.1 hypothetical protein C9I28_08355 [Pseudoduganella armeniaca]